MIVRLPDLKDRIRSGEPPPLATGWFALGEHDDVSVPTLEQARRCARVEPAQPDPCTPRVLAFDPADGTTVVEFAPDGSLTVVVTVSPAFVEEQIPELVVSDVDDPSASFTVDGTIADSCRQTLRFVISGSPALADGNYELAVTGYEQDSVLVAVETAEPPAPRDQPDPCAITLVPTTRKVGISVPSPPKEFPRPPLLAVDGSGCILDAWSANAVGRMLVPRGDDRVDLVDSRCGRLIACVELQSGTVLDAIFWNDDVAVLSAAGVALYDQRGCLVADDFAALFDGLALGVSDDGRLIVIRSGTGNVLLFRRDGSRVLSPASFDGRGWYARHRNAAFVFDTTGCEYEIDPSRVGQGCCVQASRPLTSDEALFFELIDDLPDLRNRVAYPASGEVVIGPAEEQDPLDALQPGTQWHKILLFGEVPDGCAIQVETRAFDDLPAGDPLVPSGWSRAVVATAASAAPVLSPDDERIAAASVLVLTGPGRYLWMRLTLQSNTRATPSITSVEVEQPRDGIVRFLPEFIQNSTPQDDFLRRWLSLFESTAFDGVNQRMNDYDRLFDPRYAPALLLPFLADWLQILDLARLEADPDLFRRVLARAAELAETRGSVAGIILAVQLYLGLQVQIVESFKQRSGFVLASGTSVLGSVGPALGCQTAMSCELAPTWLGDEPRLGSSFLLDCDSRTGTIPYEFTVLAPARDVCSSEQLAMLELILDTEKPAHTSYRVELTGGAGWVVGRGSVVGQTLGPSFDRDKLDPATYGIAILNGLPRPKPIGEGFALGRDSRLATAVEGQPFFRLQEAQRSGAALGMDTRLDA